MGTYLWKCTAVLFYRVLCVDFMLPGGIPAASQCLDLGNVGNGRDTMEIVVWSTGEIYLKMSENPTKKRPDSLDPSS